MKKRFVPMALVGFVAVIAGVLGTTAVSVAAGGPPRPCFRPGIYCLDVWQPVICSDGNVYSNSCYAYRACATGCVPYGGATQ